MPDRNDRAAPRATNRERENQGGDVQDNTCEEKEFPGDCVYKEAPVVGVQ